MGSQPSICFSFKLDDTDTDNYEVSNAVLWIFKNKHDQFTNVRNRTLGLHQTIVVSEVQQETNSNDTPAVKTIAVQAIDVQGKSTIYMVVILSKLTLFIPVNLSFFVLGTEISNLDGESHRINSMCSYKL